MYTRTGGVHWYLNMNRLSVWKAYLDCTAGVVSGPLDVEAVYQSVDGKMIVTNPNQDWGLDYPVARGAIMTYRDSLWSVREYSR
ncbi:hypothetical protein BD413DRAFT_575349 [Trametes elegans]|nr:hypothetical protein BD413DRAFT_575349 [Trametes elegans]